jgi:truncated hemoglobin YjbI
MSNISSTLYERIGGKTAISTLVELFYQKMQDDYRFNRFFNNNTTDEEKTQALKTLVIALLGGVSYSTEELTEVLDHFFMTAFARNKRKSFVGGSDFGFFGYIAPQNHPSTQYLTDAHSHLLKLMPDNSHYDVVMEHLTASLQQLNVDREIMTEVLTLAEQARNPVLGQ